MAYISIVLKPGGWTDSSLRPDKTGYTATLVACGWAGVGLEKVTRAFVREQ